MINAKVGAQCMQVAPSQYELIALVLTAGCTYERVEIYLFVEQVTESNIPTIPL